MKSLSAALILCLSTFACSPQREQQGKSIPLKIAVEFAESTARKVEQSGRSKETATQSALFATGATETSATPESGTATPAQETTSTDSTSPTQDSAGSTNSNVERYTVAPEKLIANGLELFKYKRAFRWLSFKVQRGSEVLKAGATELRDPQLLEVSPIELDVLRGETLTISISLFQADFMTAADADSLCRNGAPGFIRTWSGTTQHTVNEEGLVSVKLENAGDTTVHMAASVFPEGDLGGMKASEARHVLYDQLTGQQFNGELCPVSELPADGLPSGLRYLKLMSFSTPLKTHSLGILSPSFKTRLIPAGSSTFSNDLSDTRAVSELGISLATKAKALADGSREFFRMTPTEILGTSWQAIRPEVGIGTPNALIVRSGGRIEFPVRLSTGTKFSADSSKIKLLPSGPTCVVNFARTSDEGQILVVLESCQGNGTVKFKLAEGFATSDAGVPSAEVESTVIKVDNTPPNLSIMSPLNDSFVGASLQIHGQCELGGSTVELRSSGLPTLQANCTEYIPGDYRFMLMQSASGLNGQREYKIVQSDVVGNQTSLALSVRHDTSAPTVNVNTLLTALKESPTESAVFTVTAVDPPESSGGLSIDFDLITLAYTGTVTGCAKTIDSANQQIKLKNCAGNGTVKLSLPAGVARDAVGNTSAAAELGSAIVDNMGPALSITSPLSTQWVNGSFTLTGTCEHGGTAVNLVGSAYVSVSDTSVTCGPSGTFSTGVSFGGGALDGTSHSVTLSQNDALGNSTSFTRSLSLDRTIPTLSMTPSGTISINNTARVFTFAESDSGGSGISSFNVGSINISNGAGVSGCSKTFDSVAKTVTVTGCSGDGTATLTVPAGAVRDAAGNDSVSYPFSLNVDNTAPALTMNTLGTTTVSSTTVTQTLYGSCSATDGNVQLTGDVTSGQSATCSSGTYSFASFTITSGVGSKTVGVRQTDAAGNVTNQSQTLTLISLTAPSITSTLDFTSMGLRPYFTGTCDSTTGNTTTFTSTLGRQAYVNCSSGTLYGVLSLPFSSDTSGTITLTTTGPGGLTTSSTFTFTKATPGCPTGFAPIPGLTTSLTGLGNANAQHGHLRSWLDSGQDFCVMKFQAKDNSGAVGVSLWSSAAWTGISRDTAMNKCQALCTGAGCSNTAVTIQGTAGSVLPNELRGYRLISNTQWQVIARNVLQVTSNWTLGAVGSGVLYRGHSEGGPNNPVQNGADNATEPTLAGNGYHGIGEGSGPQRRALTLSNGQLIWDFAGNAWQWVSDQLSGGSGSLGVGLTSSVSLGTWSELTSYSTGNFSDLFGSGTTYTSAKGMGRLNTPSTLDSTRGIVRGGNHGFSTSDGINSGVFSSDFTRDASTAHPDVSFRCVYIP